MNHPNKKNIFVVYSPFHILLAISLAYAERDCENHLVVIKDFADSDFLIQIVKNWNTKENIFTNISESSGTYDLEHYPKSKQRWIRYYGVRKSTGHVLDYAVQKQVTDFYLFNEERPQSLGLLNYIKRNKPRGLRATYIEDGAISYNSSVTHKDLHFIILGKIFYGLWWKNVEVMGTCEVFDSIKAIFPDFIRPELKKKPVEKIDLAGIHEFSKAKVISEYLAKYQLSDELLNQLDGIVLFPHSSILKSEPDYQLIIQKLIQDIGSHGYKIATKYHPRDTNVDLLQLELPKNVLVLNLAIPVEFVFLRTKKLKFVVSDSSTTLMSALWGLNKCKVISLGRLTKKRDEQFNHVLHSLGVLLPSNAAELAETIRPV